MVPLRSVQEQCVVSCVSDVFVITLRTDGFVCNVLAHYKFDHTKQFLTKIENRLWRVTMFHPFIFHGWWGSSERFTEAFHESALRQCRSDSDSELCPKKSNELSSFNCQQILSASVTNTVHAMTEWGCSSRLLKSSCLSSPSVNFVCFFFLFWVNFRVTGSPQARWII